MVISSTKSDRIPSEAVHSPRNTKKEYGVLPNGTNNDRRKIPEQKDTRGRSRNQKGNPRDGI